MNLPQPRYLPSLLLLLLVALGSSPGLFRSIAAAPPPDAPAEDTTLTPFPASPNQFGDLVVVGNNLVLKEGEIAREVVVIGGQAEINGTVNRNLVVVMGRVRLGPRAVIRRDLVVLGGTFEADPSARLGRKRCIIGGDEDVLRNQPWLIRGSQWLRSGLFQARPLPHQYAWSWVVAGLAFLLYLLISILFPKQIQAALVPLEEKPGSALLTGLLAFMLAGPLFLLLVITVVGLAVVPFAAAALVGASLLGRVAVCRYLGRQVTTQLHPAALSRPLLELAIGAALLCLVYTVPVVGLIVWTAVAALGLGAVVLTLFKRSPRPAAAMTQPGAEAFSSATSATTSATVVEPAGLPLVRVGFWLRLAATGLDLLLIGILSAVVLQRPKWFLVLWVAYHLVLWTWRGTTIGGIVVGLKIVRPDGQPIHFAAALVRLLASFFSAAVLGLGFLWAGWGEDKQSWHDKIADTLVIRCSRSSLLG